MLPLRLLFAAIFMISLPFGLCSSSDDEGELSGEVKALKLALVAAGDDPNNVPPIGENFDCAITVAVLPEPPATPYADVHGTCLWAVEEQGNVWLVTFRETWLCADWSAEGGGYPPCVPPTGFHEWQYQVDLAGTVQLLSDRGQFAPDMS